MQLISLLYLLGIHRVLKELNSRLFIISTLIIITKGKNYPS